jgi:hypothetical protein
MFGRNLLDALPADAKARLRKRAQPKWVAPMLATLTDEVFSRQGWLFESMARRLSAGSSSKRQGISFPIWPPSMRSAAQPVGLGH